MTTRPPSRRLIGSSSSTTSAPAARTSARTPARYASLAGYAKDVTEILDALHLTRLCDVPCGEPPPITLDARPRDDHGTVILHGKGDIDAAVAPTLRPRVPALIAGARAVVVDLSAVTFFDSSGVRLLDDIARECGHHNTPLRVVAPPCTPTRRVLEIVGMAIPLAVNTLKDALTAVADPPLAR